MLKIVVVVLVLLIPAPADAQTRQRPAQQQQQRPDPSDTIPVPAFRVRPPVSPLLALGQSMLLPGWGQATLGRRGSGAFFVFWEGLALTMTVKSLRQLHYQEKIGLHPDSLDNKRAEFQDWLVVMVFNHLVAGAEAFVSANLWDFPTELTARSMPGGGVGFGVGIRVGRKRSPIRRTVGELALP